MVDESAGVLFVVSTPIGNMGDFSFRAGETLKAASFVLAEDTRHARVLLRNFGIATPLRSYHEHNEAAMTPRVVRELLAGRSVALISDSGTPLLSDPGYRLVNAALDAGVTVSPVPGASALLAALAISGLPAVPFTFVGFLPRRGRQRADLLAQIGRAQHTVVFYEAANRLAATLQQLAAVCENARQVVVARELTKLYEEMRRGTLADLSAYYRESEARGEVVVLIAAASVQTAPESEWEQLAASLREQGLSTRDIVRILVEQHNAPRNAAYRLAKRS